MRGNAQFILKVNFEPSTWISNKTIREVGNIFFCCCCWCFHETKINRWLFFGGGGLHKNMNSAFSLNIICLLYSVSILYDKSHWRQWWIMTFSFYQDWRNQDQLLIDFPIPREIILTKTTSKQQKQLTISSAFAWI